MVICVSGEDLQDTLASRPRYLMIGLASGESSIDVEVSGLAGDF